MFPRNSIFLIFTDILYVCYFLTFRRCSRVSPVHSLVGSVSFCFPQVCSTRVMRLSSIKRYIGGPIIYNISVAFPLILTNISRFLILWSEFWKSFFPIQMSRRILMSHFPIYVKTFPIFSHFWSIMYSFFIAFKFLI